jgi:hypothetical protein
VIQGMDNFLKNLRAIDQKVNAAVDTTAKQISQDAKGQIQRELSKAGTGIIYLRRRGGMRGFKGKDGWTSGRRGQSSWADKGQYIAHQASAPGEPPAPDYGKLRSSVDTKIEGQSGSKIIYIKTGDQIANYAEALEKGSAHVKPRPFFEVTIQRNTPKWYGWWKNNLAGACKK